MTPLLDGIENLVDVLQQLAKDRGLGDHLKADLAKIRRSKAPALQEGDDFKTWLLGEMPVHAATKYKSYVDDSAFMGQLWVGRQLEFWVEVISALSDGKASSAAVDAAYKATLKKHHGILQAAAFSAVLKGLPSREELLGLLRGEAEETVLRKELKAFVDSGRAIAKYMLALDKEIDALRANERRNFSQ
jgi:hypothetical protein